MSEVPHRATAPTDVGSAPLAKLELLDQYGASVFAALCRVTGADRDVAHAALRDALVELQLEHRDAPAGRLELLLAAHAHVLRDPRAEDGPGVASARLDQPLASGTAGVIAPGAPTLAERVAINLHVIERLAVDAVATLFDDDEARVRALVTAVQTTASGVFPEESVEATLRRDERWLGDDERDAIRAALIGSAHRRSTLRSGSEPRSGSGLRSRSGPRSRFGPRSGRRVGVGLGLVVIWFGVLGVAGWIADRPEQPVTVGIVRGSRLAAPPPPPTDPTPVVAPSTDIAVTPLVGALGSPQVVLLASGLVQPEVVRPDMIARYDDGKIGLSWHSPCNRPASSVAITNTDRGTVVELTTGEFPVLSCVGMPDRWTAVVTTTIPLASGPIVPVTRGGVAESTFDGSIDLTAPSLSDVPTTVGATSFGSALVDEADQPWVYGLGCASTATPYGSPAGPIFEIRRSETLDPDSYSAGDAMVCNELAGRPILTGPLGATFPQAAAEDSTGPPVHRDCRGPAGSPLDVPDQASSRSRFYDGVWSNWQGCLVRTDVIRSVSNFLTCEGEDVRTLSFAPTLGDRILSVTKPLTFVRDPGWVVRGTRSPLIRFAKVPRGLIDTGLRFDDQALWLSPTRRDAIYIRIGDDVERWPLLNDEIFCA